MTRDLLAGAVIALWIGLIGPVLAHADASRPLIQLAQACNNPYGCAHNSLPTGSQSHQPNDPPCTNPYGCGRGLKNGGPNPPGKDVYCQQENGKPDYGPYHKTGRNIPCGPAFQPQKPAQQKPETESCPVRQEQTGDAGPNRPTLYVKASISVEDTAPFRLAQNKSATDQPWPGAGLYVGGKEIGSMAEVPGLKPFLDQGNAAVRKEIYRQMRCHWHRRFEFKAGEDLKKNIKIREGVIGVMNDIKAGTVKLEFLASATASQYVLPSDAWEKYWAEGDFGGGSTSKQKSVVNGVSKDVTWTLTFHTSNKKTASAAIDSFLSGVPSTLTAFGKSRLDCLMGVQMAVLSGVKRALGTTEFDTLHSFDASDPNQDSLYGVGIPILVNGRPASFKTSPNQHLIPLRWTDRTDGDPSYITESDMVLGDYAYLSNPVTYRVYNPDGAWAGENAIFMQSGRFFGLGFNELISAGTLRQELAENYNKGFGQLAPIGADQTRWTLLAAPVRNGDRGEGGPFVAAPQAAATQNSLGPPAEPPPWGGFSPN